MCSECTQGRGRGAWLPACSECTQGRGYLRVVSAHRSLAAVGAVRVALLWVGEGEVFHLVVPGLNVERGRAVSETGNIYRDVQCSLISVQFSVFSDVISDQCSVISDPCSVYNQAEGQVRGQHFIQVQLRTLDCNPSGFNGPKPDLFTEFIFILIMLLAITITTTTETILNNNTIIIVKGRVLYAHYIITITRMGTLCN